MTLLEKRRYSRSTPFRYEASWTPANAAVISALRSEIRPLSFACSESGMAVEIQPEGPTASTAEVIMSVMVSRDTEGDVWSGEMGVGGVSGYREV